MILAKQKLHAQVDCPHWSHPLLEPAGILGHHFWRLRGGMPSSLMLCQHRHVGSSLLPNRCASTAKLKWNVSEVLHRCSSFGASGSGKATMVVEDIREVCIVSHSSKSGSKAQGLDHACPLGPGARSARLLFSVLD